MTLEIGKEYYVKCVVREVGIDACTVSVKDCFTGITKRNYVNKSDIIIGIPEKCDQCLHPDQKGLCSCKLTEKKGIEQKPKVQKWEYDNRINYSIERFNKMGEEGWELFLCTTPSSGEIVYHFKRPINK